MELVVGDSGKPRLIRMGRIGLSMRGDPQWRLVYGRADMGS